jgi:hypothetical protein
MATITLPADLERAISAQARAQGTTLELLALDKLQALFLPDLQPEDASEAETMAEFLKDFIGCIDSRDVIAGGANLSEASGRKLGELLVKKHREGRL